MVRVVVEQRQAEEYPVRKPMHTVDATLLLIRREQRAPDYYNTLLSRARNIGRPCVSGKRTPTSHVAGPSCSFLVLVAAGLRLSARETAAQAQRSTLDHDEELPPDDVEVKEFLATSLALSLRVPLLGFFFVAFDIITRIE